MVSLARSFLKSWALCSLLVLAFAGAVNAAESKATGSVADNDAEKAELVAEIAVRDSVMAIHDSVCIAEKKALRSDLEIETAKCENWEQSYNMLKKNNETCAKALSIAVQASQEQAEKQKAKDEKIKKEEKKDMVVQTASMAASFGLGMLIMWLILD